MSGIEFADRLITIQNHTTVGGCEDCVIGVLPILKVELADLEVELPDNLRGNRRWKRWKTMKCDKCGWEGHEGEMGRIPALMGGGYYQGKCPKCAAENRLFNTDIRSTGGWRVVEVRETPKTKSDESLPDSAKEGDW